MTESYNKFLTMFTRMKCIDYSQNLQCLECYKILVVRCTQTGHNRRVTGQDLIPILCNTRGTDKSLARPGRKEASVSLIMAWISFGALPCRGWEKNLMTARVSMLLKSRASLTWLSQPVHGTATYRWDDTTGCIIQFWPDDDGHMVLETCRGMK